MRSIGKSVARGAWRVARGACAQRSLSLFVARLQKRRVPSGSVWLCSSTMMKTACERDDASFIDVDAVARSAAPRSSRPCTSAQQQAVHLCSSRPCTTQQQQARGAGGAGRARGRKGRRAAGGKGGRGARTEAARGPSTALRRAGRGLIGVCLASAHLPLA
eukprot:5221245-Pleurochrysis_carterae.AAC.2